MHLHVIFSSMGGEGCDIAVIDDDAGMSQAIERLLAASGWGAMAFPSAEAFMQSDLFRLVRLIVLDIQLPGMSGPDLHQRMNDAGRTVSVIYITGHDHPYLRHKAELAGAADYFTKPFAGQLLIEAVRKHHRVS